MYERSAEGWAKHLDFILLDMICLEISLALAYILRHGIYNPFTADSYRNLSIVVLFLDFALLLFLDTLKNVLKRGAQIEAAKTVRHTVLLTLVLIAYLFAIHDEHDYSRVTIFSMGLIYCILTLAMRMLWKKLIRQRTGVKSGNSLLILSSEKRAPEIMGQLKKYNYGHYERVAWVFHDDYKVGMTVEGIPVVATYDTVEDYVKSNWVDEVLIAVPAYDPFPRDIIDQLTAMGMTVHVNLDKSADLIGLKQVVGNVGGLMVITMSLNTMSIRAQLEKRLLDILGGIAGCILTGILYLLLAPRIKKESPGPVFFTQTRIGKNGKPFKLYKFRSMYLDAEERKKELMSQNRIGNGLMFKMEFDPRVIGNKIDENGNRTTGIGEFIRKYSLDEFPQFYNVLKGDMSLVGTRPPTQEEVRLYEARHRMRLATKPGITGMWQVNGRSNVLDFEEVVRLDASYINEWSIWLDLKILLKTVLVVFKKEGSM